MADPNALISGFDRFLTALPPAPGPRPIVIPLTTFRGLSSESLNAAGSVSIDLAAGSVTSQVRGLPADGRFDLWLLDNRPAPRRSTLADPGDVLLKIGAYLFATGAHQLSVTLPSSTFAAMMPDRAFVVRSGATPENAFVLTGSNSIFDRLMRRQVRFVDRPDAALGFDPAASATRAADFAKLIAQGRQTFVSERFEGNGRACGTCHVESNNFTIDPAFIAGLPPADPLFVAERNAALAVDFEKPELMRRFGLFVENADGFGDLRTRFTMRSAQNVLALSNSMTRPDPSFGIDFTSNGKNADPPDRLGWGNDGPPLRDFAMVAIVQHATKTLNRRLGTDFRLPTDEELDALAAYQLALGRQEDFDLKVLQLKSSFATSGKALYLDTGNLFEPGHKNCNACHFNAGGTAAMSFNPTIPGSPRADGSPRGFNMSGATGVNDTPVALQLGLPRDGGFGAIFHPAFGGFGNEEDLGPFGVFQLEEFNTPPLVEAADTAPFFHNHSVPDLESAIAFYGTPAFQAGRFSIGNGFIPVRISADPNDPEVRAIAAFLRVLNALENIRSSISVGERARAMRQDEDVHDLARLAAAETSDAINVLSTGALQRSQEQAILSARANLLITAGLLVAAQHAPRPVANLVVDEALKTLRGARSALADPATLPLSYRN
jgi:cytochrome c peroxidase